MPGILGNPLLRHVRRHAGTTILFRSPASALSAPASRRRGDWIHLRLLPADGPVAAAFLAPAGASWAEGIEDAASLQRTPPSSTEGGGVVRDAGPMATKPVAQPVAWAGATIPTRAPAPDVRRAPADLAPSAATESRREAEQPAVPVQRATTSGPSETARCAAAAEAQPQPGERATIDDTTWRRLETIYARHQEKQAAEREPSEPPVVAPSSSSEVPPEAPVASPAPATQLQPAPNSEAADPARVGPQSRLVEPGAEPERPASLPLGASAHDSGADATAVVAAASLQAVAVRQPAVSRPGQPALTMPATQPVSAEVSAPPEPGKVGGSVESPQQSLPLEAVWPVQRTDMPHAATRPPSTTEPAAVIAPAATPTASAVSIPHLAPSRPTASAVEVIPPRGPRPTRQSAFGPAKAEADAAASGAAVATPEPEQQAEEGLSRTQEPRRGPMIETGIGPLPADLWKLLDQQAPSLPDVETTIGPTVPRPPRPQASPGVSQPAMQRMAEATATGGEVMTPAAQPGAGSSTSSREPATHEALLEPTIVSTRPMEGTEGPLRADRSEPIEAVPLGSLEPKGSSGRLEAAVIQRQAEPGAASGSPAAGGAPAEPEKVDASQAADVDELARRVYPEIKRRLVVEWERTRRSF